MVEFSILTIKKYLMVNIKLNELYMSIINIKKPILLMHLLVIKLLRFRLLFGRVAPNLPCVTTNHLTELTANSKR